MLALTSGEYPHPRAHGSLATIAGKLYLFGGEHTDKASQNAELFNDIHTIELGKIRVLFPSN